MCSYGFTNFNSNIIFLDNYYLNNKKIFIFIFFIFAFYWNQKTIVTGDVATNTLYKIIYRTSKNIFNFSSIRLFQKILEFHKKYKNIQFINFNILKPCLIGH